MIQYPDKMPLFLAGKNKYQNTKNMKNTNFLEWQQREEGHVINGRAAVEGQQWKIAV